MGAIVNVEGIVIVNSSLDWMSCTECSVTSVGHACMFTMYRIAQNFDGGKV